MTASVELQSVNRPPLARRIAAAVETRRWYRDLFEIGLVALAFLLYFLVRGAVVDQHEQALENARSIIDLQRQLGIFWEPRMQEWILDKRLLIEIMNFIYFWLDFPLIVAVGFWLYFTHRHEYTVTRDAMLLSGAIALVIYNLYPVMPPRLLPTGEFVGTIEQYNDLSYQASTLSPFVNPYAAMPSLHFGWAIILGGAMVVTMRHPLWRVFGFSLPWLQFAAIIFTANHFILDAFGGLLVCLAGIVLALAAQRWLYPWIGRRFAPDSESGTAGPP